MSAPSNQQHQQQRRRRRRRPLAGTSSIVTTAVVAYGAYRVADYFWNRTTENDNETVKGELSASWLPSWLLVNRGGTEQHQHALDPRTSLKLRRQRVFKCRNETLKAYKSCVPAMKKIIEASTNTTQETKELKLLRKGNTTNNDNNNNNDNKENTNQAQAQAQARQDDLWDTIQRQSLTRLLATTYASALLFLSLTVQIHWVGGQLFRHHLNAGTITTRSSTTTTHQAQCILMQTHEYFLKQGLPLLLEAIRRALSTTLDWKHTQFLSLSDIQTAFDSLQETLDYGAGTATTTTTTTTTTTKKKKKKKKYPRNWIRLVLPESSGTTTTTATTTSSNDDTTSMDELWDLAQSPAWQDAQAQVLQTTWKYLREEGWGTAFVSETTTNNNTTDVQQEQQEQRLPLAKLISQFKASCQQLYKIDDDDTNDKDHTTNSLTAKLQTLPTILELGDVSFQ
jgi:hypothetical protein